MLSRVADSIFWMGRYIERAENIARFFDVNQRLSLDTGADSQSMWQPLITVTGDRDLFFEKYGEVDEDRALDFLVFDPTYPNSIRNCAQMARENARAAREVISYEMWEVVNQFYITMTESTARTRARHQPHEFFEEIKRLSHLFIGLYEGTMLHGLAWHFIRMGRLLERADKTSRLLDVKYFILLPSVEMVGTAIDNIQWTAVLTSASALDMYRKLYTRISPREIAEFLILNREFPRSIRSCVIETEESLHRITGVPDGHYTNLAEKELGRLRGELDFTSVEEIIDGGLHEYLDNIQSRLNHVGEAIYQTFFALRPEPLPPPERTEAALT